MPRIDLERGEGLTFLHGAAGRGEVWQLQALAFPRAQTPDLAGREGGDPPASVAGHVAALRALLDASAVLAGHSLGGAVALQYALEGSPGLRGLILMGTGAGFPDAREWAGRLQESDRGRLQEGDAALRALADRFFGPTAPPRLKEKSLALLRAMNGRVIVADVAAAAGFDVRDRLGGVLLPVLIIAGTEDRAVAPRQAEFLHAHLPRAELVWIEGAGHMMMLEQPQATNQAIRAFLQRLAKLSGARRGGATPG